MPIPLTDWLDMDAPEVADFDLSVDQVALQRSVRTYFDNPNSRSALRRCWRRYTEWCALKRKELQQQLDDETLQMPTRVHDGYQDDPRFITAEKLAELAVYMTRVKRWAPSTCDQMVWALQIHAANAGVTVNPKLAQAVIRPWRETVEELKAKAAAEAEAKARAEAAEKCRLR